VFTWPDAVKTGSIGAVTIADGKDTLFGALAVLRERVGSLRFPLELEDVASSRRTRREIVAQLDDYVLPRIVSLDAPMLAVVGGSTGAGKSTLVNAIIGKPVTETGVLRPTTRAPLLACHPDDVEWFNSDRVLPDLVRTDLGEAASPGSIYLVADPAVPQGLALLDAPDVDSVVTENRALSSQLLAAADLWIFVTTAARYADAVPWGFLLDASQRSAAVAVVLDRVPPEAVVEVRHHLATMLDSHGLGDSPMFIVEEAELGSDRMLAAEHIEPLLAWLQSLSSHAGERSALIRRTLDGAMTDLTRRAPTLATAADLQAATADHLRSIAVAAYNDALSGIDKASRDGSLLRGEVLARWQDFVGTGEFFRSLEDKVGKVRDRIGTYLRDKAQPVEAVEEAIGQGLEALFLGEADAAAERVASAWHADPAGRALLGKHDLSRSSKDLPQRVADEVSQWQSAVFDMVRNEGQDKRFTARVMSFGLNGIAVALMVVVFASTGGLTGAEVGIAGGTAVVGQKLLEAIFGDQAVRRMAESARHDLNDRAEALLSAESARFTQRVDVLALEPTASAALRSALGEVERARLAERES
jgi:energy-coupling factor transporter ATP-binding protein EcfA2